jgi:DNA-binding NarL/FixJ family response regulator
MLFLPEGTPEQMAWYDELMRTTTSADAAARLYEARGAVDVVATAPRVSARTLVIHARRDKVVPVEEMRQMAALIPDSRFVLLDSPNHILLGHEPAWEKFLSALREFLGASQVSARPGDLSDLTSRELEVLELVAAGRSNEAIAEHLMVSVRTVERHLSNVYAKLRISGKAARTLAAVSLIDRRT